jgi:nicotinamide-nucleotide amidase
MPVKRAGEVIIDLLRERGESLSLAESLTGGGLGAAITAVPGASEVFIGGLAAYQIQIKQDLLKVSPALIAQFGVVSEEVAIAMAEGARSLFNSTWAIATTGVAGPDAVDGNPAGTVWVAIRGPINQSTQLQLSGTREIVRNATVSSAVTTFARILTSLGRQK